LNHQNKLNELKGLSVTDNAEKSFNILATSLNILHNYFDGPKLFSDLYPVKFLDISARLFFQCTQRYAR